MSRHTALPWHKAQHGLTIHDPTGICIAEVFCRGSETPDPHANAELIVRACNAYDELLAACKLAKGVIMLRNEHDDRMCRGDVAAFKKLDSAIAKAEGSNR